MSSFKQLVLDGLGEREPQVLVKAEIVLALSALDRQEFEDAIEGFRSFGEFYVTKTQTITPRHRRYMQPEESEDEEPKDDG